MSIDRYQNLVSYLGKSISPSFERKIIYCAAQAGRVNGTCCRVTKQHTDTGRLAAHSSEPKKFPRYHFLSPVLFQVNF